MLYLCRLLGRCPLHDSRNARRRRLYEGGVPIARIVTYDRYRDVIRGCGRSRCGRLVRFLRLRVYGVREMRKTRPRTRSERKNAYPAPWCGEPSKTNKSGTATLRSLCRPPKSTSSPPQQLPLAMAAGHSAPLIVLAFQRLTGSRLASSVSQKLVGNGLRRYQVST